jgi:acyl-CoA oxidase
MVQLPSLDDHSLLPSITPGDIGGKLSRDAYNNMDNGVLSFDHVCIPREQMLMRFVHWPIFFWHFFVCQIYFEKYYVILL